jgi:carboxyl-terminal processing protease
MGSPRNIIAAAVVGLLLLVGGIWLGGHPETLPGFARNGLVSDDRALRSELVDDIKDNFYKPVSDRQIDESSLKGIVQGLNDRFSNYLTPKETSQFRESVQGRFDGVGMSVDKDRRGLRVLNVFDGSPAKKAGIKKGDFVTEVNGKPIAGLSSSVATARIKGPAGTKVRLQIVDVDKGTTKDFPLERKRIEVPVAEGRTVERGGRTYGVVKLQGFSQGAHGLLRKQVDKVRKSGAEGIVLDLRGNGGGLLDEGVLVASIFIDKGLITYTKGRTSPRRNFDAKGGAIPKSVPVVVLVDRGSASASEIVTGALRDTRRATVVGTRTFGKGVFQQVLPLSNGGVLDITVGEYFLPGGKNINGKGIKPAVKASDDPDTKRDEALPKALEALSRK